MLNDSNLLKAEQKCAFCFQFPLHDAFASFQPEIRSSLLDAEHPFFPAACPAGVTMESIQCIADDDRRRLLARAAQDSKSPPELRYSSLEFYGESVLDEKELRVSRERSQKRPRQETECTALWETDDVPISYIDFCQSVDVQIDATQADTNANANASSKRKKEKTVRFSACND
jgi:hypothetical protein